MSAEQPLGVTPPLPLLSLPSSGPPAPELPGPGAPPTPPASEDVDGFPGGPFCRSDVAEQPAASRAEGSSATSGWMWGDLIL
ncbi:hypothetical protein [Sorangium cellulosum]|uniref:Uncharacterized protein n=1 Tax=Sorangium cellulosum TaxID=56 RepID=A0A150QBF5_SORCE|nr:hypothetical protein [Sorangium cellulosum]KYF65046.1 hypothetical protein BE15_28925 [Sorangium cellulosum]